MRLLTLVLVLSSFFFAREARTAPLGISDLYAGPVIGTTSFNPASGASNREYQMSYGAEVFNYWKLLGLGAFYRSLPHPTEGTQSVNVQQQNSWLAGEARLRLFSDGFSPYVSAGAGAFFQTVTTEVMGASERADGVFFARAFGIGVTGRVMGNWGVSLCGRYYEYSNVNGFDYTVSVGYFPGF